MAEQNVTIQTAISMQRGKLVVNYTVTNQSENTMHLANRVSRTLFKPVMNENIAYIFKGDDGVLHIQKDFPAIPEGMSPTDIVAPFTIPLPSW